MTAGQWFCAGLACGLVVAIVAVCHVAWGRRRVACPACGGSGTRTWMHSPRQYLVTGRCPDCDGSGLRR